LEAAEKLHALKGIIAQGKKIDILKIEPPVVPAIILGYDETTRMESKNIIFHLNLLCRV